MGRKWVTFGVWVWIGLILSLLAVQATEDNPSHPPVIPNITSDDVIGAMESDDVNPGGIIDNDMKWQQEVNATGLEVTSTTTTSRQTQTLSGTASNRAVTRSSPVSFNAANSDSTQVSPRGDAHTTVYKPAAKKDHTPTPSLSTSPSTSTLFSSTLTSSSSSLTSPMSTKRRKKSSEFPATGVNARTSVMTTTSTESENRGVTNSVTSNEEMPTSTVSGSDVISSVGMTKSSVNVEISSEESTTSHEQHTPSSEDIRTSSLVSSGTTLQRDITTTLSSETETETDTPVPSTPRSVFPVSNTTGTLSTSRTETLTRGDTEQTTKADKHPNKTNSKTDSPTETMTTGKKVTTSASGVVTTETTSLAESSVITSSVTPSTTTDCAQALKVDLDILKIGQNNVTLTWQPLNSGSSVGVVYHVRVKGAKGGDSCVLYTVGEEAAPESPSAEHRRRRRRETCRTMPERLTADQGTVVIPNLQPCTSYDVTVTSVCGACPCHDADTSAMVSLSTLDAVPGKVERIQVVQNDTDSSSLGVTWAPPDHPTCRDLHYLLRLSRDGTCVAEIRLLGQEEGEEEEEDGEGVENDDGNSCDVTTTYGSLTSPKVVFHNLLPDTEYQLNVSAVNDAGRGVPVLRPVRTGVAVPSSPTHFHVTEVTSDRMTIEWQPPEPRPGPTDYWLQLLDMGSPYTDPLHLLHNTTHHCGGVYEAYNCTVDSLTPYWTYNLTLMAHTARGFSVPAVLPELVTTLPAAPGAIDKLKIQAADDSVKTVTVTWNCPALKNRNTRIVGFIIQALLQSVGSGSNDTVDVRHVPTEDCDVRNSEVFEVIPERQYFFRVLTLGLKYNASQWTTASYFAPPGRSEAVSSLSVQRAGATNVTLEWSRPLVTNGQLTGYGVTVKVKDGACLSWTSVVLEKSTTEKARAPGTDCRTQTTVKNMTFTPASQSITLTLNDLPPDTPLTLTVYPRNNAGWGLPANVSAHTEETVPTAPKHISATPINATTLAVSWRPPEPRPGATNYTIVLYRATELDNSSPTFLSPTSLTLTGWRQRRAVVTGLWSGWRYSLTLVTLTSKGSRTVQLTPFQMPQSPPGHVKNVSVLPLANDYRHVTVTWDYPALMDRNGIIVNFTSCCQRQRTKREKCLTIQQPCQLKSPQFCATFNVIPGHDYTLKVRANNEFDGIPTENSFQAKIGPAPDLFEVPVTSALSTVTSQSTFRVEYCATCLLNDTNGDITLIALLVCHKAFCHQVSRTALSKPTDIMNLPSWKMAKGNNFKSFYRPTEDTWLNTVRTHLDTGGGARRVANNSRMGVYTVGEEKDCESRAEDDHCNGPLPSGQAFRVLTISCTSASCSTSALSSPVATASLPARGVGTLTILGCALGAALALVVVCIFLWFRHRRQRRKPKVDDRGDTEGEEFTEMTHSHRQLTIQDFRDTLREWKSIVEDSGFPTVLVQQFEDIRSFSARHSKTAATLTENRLKNRYTNILPFDHSRVKLVQIDDDVTTDYINANYIPGYHSKREYIATQGPLQGTVDDFWRMVWEQKCAVIVMLSALTEGRLTKVHKYFPDEDQVSEPVSYGMVTVTLLQVVPREDYLVRTFRLNVGESQREVKQFFVDSWKDFKANLTPSLVLDFVRAVREEVPPDNKHPLVLHCSAGVGRTGTWIAIDYFMQYIRHSPPSAPLNIRQFVLTMRENRAHMVQSLEQYVFLHEVVAELVRRKTEVDRYDEPIYCNEPVYANLAFEHESESPSSSSGTDSKSSNVNGNNSNSNNDDSSDDNESNPPPCPTNPVFKGTPSRPPRSRTSVISAVTSRM